MAPFIRCENLVKIYKVADLERVALQGLDLEVAAGETVGIVGPSGAGKSTLLHILGGLDRPSAGKVKVGDRDLVKMSDRDLDTYRLQEVGFLWQIPARNLVPYLTIRENVQLPMLIAGNAATEREARTRALLAQVGLWEHQNHRPVELSGGQQQRAALAVALANAPRLLLADEPTGELDSESAREIYRMLRQLSGAYGLTTLIVTHDPQVIHHADRVVAIRDGRVSTETIRREGDWLQSQMRVPKEAPAGYKEYVVVDPSGRLHVPRPLLEKVGITDRAEVEVREDGIVLRAVGRIDHPSQTGKREPRP